MINYSMLWGIILILAGLILYIFKLKQLSYCGHYGKYTRDSDEVFHLTRKFFGILLFIFGIILLSIGYYFQKNIFFNSAKGGFILFISSWLLSVILSYLFAKKQYYKLFKTK